MSIENEILEEKKMTLKNIPESHTSPEISRTFKLYNYCVNHTDYSIDWTGFFVLADHFDVEEIEDEIEYVDHLRRLNATRLQHREDLEKQIASYSDSQNEIFMNSMRMIKEKKLKEREEARKLKELEK